MNMFRACHSITSAYVNEFKTTNKALYRELFKDSINLSSITVNFTSWNDTYLIGNTYEWVSGVATSGVFYKPEELPTTYGIHYIPNGWTVINKE